jgi:molybdopterin molybdotransferase
MMDRCSRESESLLTVVQALEKIKTAVDPIAATETVFLKQAVGRVLSSSIYSPINIPSDRNAAMDGYAFASADIVSEQAFTLNLVGTSWAGQPFEGDLQTGQCIRVFTGAVVPSCVDSVLMQEQVRVDGQIVHFPANLQVRQNVRAVGEDIKQGELLCAHPKKLTVYDLGLLAAAGIYQVSVKRKIRIAFFSTGDELTRIGRPLEPGKIYDSNRYLLSELLNDTSFSVTDCGVIADDKQLLQDVLIKASKSHDVLLTTGGASVGEADFIHDILANCGQVKFWKLAIKPGKPLAFGKIGDCHFFGLPGNPASLVVTFQQLVAPALRQISGASPCQALRVTATCTSKLKKIPGRLEFQRGILTQDDNGDFFVASSGSQGSHFLGSMSKANCFIILPAECYGIKVGDKAIVEPFSVYI